MRCCGDMPFILASMPELGGCEGTMSKMGGSGRFIEVRCGMAPGRGSGSRGPFVLPTQGFPIGASREFSIGLNSPLRSDESVGA